MHLVKKWKCDCEEWMRHPFDVFDDNTGYNLFMTWLQHVHTEPPEWMKKNFDPLLQRQSTSRSNNKIDITDIVMICNRIFK